MRFPAFEATGLLLLSDATRPAVAQLVAGEPIRGSWWGHPKGKAIYAAATALEDDPDVATCKLVDGKVTFVHRRWWPAIVAIGQSGAAWQTRGLPREAADLFAEVRARGRVASDDPALPWDGKQRKAAFGGVAERLLCATFDEHTARGAHRTVAVAWERWADERGVVALDGDEAEAVLGAAVVAFGGTPPWARRAR